MVFSVYHISSSQRFLDEVKQYTGLLSALCVKVAACSTWLAYIAAGRTLNLNLLCSPQVYFIPHTLNCLLLPMVNKNGKMQTWPFIKSQLCIHQYLHKA